MHRLTVIILAAVDAAIAAAVGLAATLAPLCLLWVFGVGGTAQWSALWPTAASIWQFGHLVPLTVTLPGGYLADSGIDADAASFVLSLAPLAFAVFTAIFAARSGVRASKADAWITGAITGTLVFTVVTVLVALTSATDVVASHLWQAILFPALLFALPLWAGAALTEWREAAAGAIARLRDRVEAAGSGWGGVPGLVVRGGAITAVGLIGAGALLLAVALVLRGGDVIALFEAAHVDALGATVVTLAQAAYLPTLVIWALAFVAGPGFAVGVGTTVSPAGTQLGVVPGIPILGVVPESTTPWLLLLALVPIGLGALAGWVARSGLVSTGRGVGAEGDSRSEDPVGPRFVSAIGIAVLAAAATALLALLASGAIGPGRLAELGPRPGPLALAVGLEVLLGAAILLLSPRRQDRAERAGTAKPTDSASEPVPAEPAPWERVVVGSDANATEPIEPIDPLEPTTPVQQIQVRYDPDPDDIPTAEFGPRRPTLPPNG